MTHDNVMEKPVSLRSASECDKVDVAFFAHLARRTSGGVPPPRRGGGGPTPSAAWPAGEWARSEPLVLRVERTRLAPEGRLAKPRKRCEKPRASQPALSQNGCCVFSMLAEGGIRHSRTGRRIAP